MAPAEYDRHVIPSPENEAANADGESMLDSAFGSHPPRVAHTRVHESPVEEPATQ